MHDQFENDAVLISTLRVSALSVIRAWGFLGFGAEGAVTLIVSCNAGMSES